MDNITSIRIRNFFVFDGTFCESRNPSSVFVKTRFIDSGQTILPFAMRNSWIAMKINDREIHLDPSERRTNRSILTRCDLPLFRYTSILQTRENRIIPSSSDNSHSWSRARSQQERLRNDCDARARLSSSEFSSTQAECFSREVMQERNKVAAKSCQERDDSSTLRTEAYLAAKRNRESHREKKVISRQLAEAISVTRGDLAEKNFFWRFFYNVLRHVRDNFWRYVKTMRKQR